MFIYIFIYTYMYMCMQARSDVVSVVNIHAFLETLYPIIFSFLVHLEVNKLKI